MKRYGASKRRGFTLVEVLVGTTIAVLIVGAAYSTYLAAANSWQKSRSTSANYQYGRAAMSVMERSIRSALPPSNDTGIVFTGESYVIEGTELAADSVRFTCTGNRFTVGRPGMSDIAEIEFFLDISESLGEPSLMMRRRVVPSEDPEYEGEVDELAPNVVSFNVRYHDGIDFVDEWEGQELPQAVQISLVLYNFDGESPVSFHKLVTLATH